MITFPKYSFGVDKNLPQHTARCWDHKLIHFIIFVQTSFFSNPVPGIVTFFSGMAVLSLHGTMYPLFIAEIWDMIWEYLDMGI